ncbi:WD40 repeat domain-containing protein [Micromonospora violae]|uniref:WD40 repeat domain-containing protein n=1 Tax=Micromonospora violae TaxID=1278207 RepID=UPI0013EEFBE9|nr:WD40 repeat domain-containing protein [Micromonospora violae]
MLAVSLVIAVVAFGFAWQQRNEALERAHVAASQAMAARSIELAEQDPRIAAQLALYSRSAQPTSESARALAVAVDANQNVVRHLRGGSNTVAGFQGSAGGNSTEVAISRDGGTLAYYSHYDSDQAVHIYDIRTGIERRLATGEYPLGGGFIELSADGGLLALEVWPNQVEVWDVREATKLRTLKAGDPSELANADDGLWAVAFSPSGRWLAATYHTSGSDDRQLAVWDVQTGAPLSQGVSRAERLTFDARERLLAWDSGRLRRFTTDTRAWAVIGKPHAAKAGEEVRALFPDGRALISTDSAGTTELWDLLAARRQGINRDGGRLEATLPTGDASTVVGSLDREVAIYDTALQSRVTLGSFAWPTSSLAVSGDGRWVAAGSLDGAVTLFDAAKAHTGEVLPSKVPKAGDLVPHGRLALRVVGSTTEVWAATDDDSGPRRLGLLPVEFDLRDDALAVNTDGTRAVFLDKSDPPITAEMSLWDLRTGEQIGRKETYLGYDVSFQAEAGIHFLADGVHIVVLGRDGPLLIDTRSWMRRQIGAEGSGAHAVAISDDGGTLALLNIRATVTVWRWAGGNLDKIREISFESHGAEFGADLTVSPRGDKVALIDGDGRLVIADVDSGDVVNGLAGNGGDHAVFSRDARLLVQPDRAGPVVVLRFWDTSSAESAGSWTIRQSRDARMTLTTGDRILVVASDGSVTASNMNIDAWKNLLCGLLDAPKPPAPYDRYLSGLDIDKPCRS